MVLKQSNQFVYGALTMALLIAVGVGLYFFVSNLSRPTPTTPDEDKQMTVVPTVVSQPEVKPTAEVSQPTVDLASTGVVFRGGPQRTGVFDTPGPERGELTWKFEALGVIFSSPAMADGVVYFGSQGNKFYAIDAVTGQEKWQFQTGAGVKSSPAIAASEDFVASSPLVTEGMVYFGSGDTYVYALDVQTGQER